MISVLPSSLKLYESSATCSLKVKTNECRPSAQYSRVHTAHNARDYIKFSFVLVVSPPLVLKRHRLKHLFILCKDKFYFFICIFKKQVLGL